MPHGRREREKFAQAFKAVLTFDQPHDEAQVISAVLLELELFGIDLVEVATPQPVK